MSAAAEDRPGWGLTATGFTVVAFLQLPVIVVVLAAFSTTSYLTIPPQGLTLAWFGKVLSDPGYLSAIRMSLILACGSTLISLVLGVAAAYALFRKVLPGSEAVTSFLMAPLVMPAVVVGVALLQFYSMTGLRGSLIGLLLAHVVITVPYVVRSALASLSGLDLAVEEAARVLGASGFEAFRLVTLPLIAPGLVELAERHPMIGDVRGVGVFWALELVADRETRTPATAATMGAVKRELMARRLLPFLADNRIHVVPPCIVTEDEVARALAIYDEALTAVETAT